MLLESQQGRENNLPFDIFSNYTIDYTIYLPSYQMKAERNINRLVCILLLNISAAAQQ